MVLCAAAVHAQEQEPYVFQVEAEPVVVDATVAADALPPGTDVVVLRGSQGGLPDALDALPGVRLTRTGGEGAAFQLNIRGLGGRRTATYLGPVRLDDPVTGTLDLFELPAGALDRVSLTRGASVSSEGALGGVLRLEPRVPLAPTLRGAVSLGSEHLWALDVAAGAPVAWKRFYGGATVLLRGTSTDGRFAFTPVVGSRDKPTVLDARGRVNNDRQRVGFTLLGAGEWLGGPSGSAVLDVSVLQGGIPGFGVQPLTHAREKQVRTALGAQVRLPAIWELEGAAETAVRHSAWHHEDTRLAAPRTGALQSLGWTGVVGASFPVFPMLRADAGVLWAVDGALSLGDGGTYRVVRPAAGMHAGLKAALWNGRINLEARIRTQGWMVQAADTVVQRPRPPQLVVLPEVRAQWMVVPGLSLESMVGRAWRNPSLEELYRPLSAALSGNADLLPEDGAEVGGGFRFVAGPLLATAHAYGARMSNMIAYININAFDVRPQNVGGVWRAGTELVTQLSLGPWGDTGAGVDAHWTRVDATGMPLPTVPLLEGRASMRLGPPRARLVLESTARSGATGNLYGELPIRPALRLNAGVEVELHRGFALRALVRNLADDRSQTDLWGVPQPGREVFLTLTMDPGRAAQAPGMDG
jgi:hypothetical protein